MRRRRSLSGSPAHHQKEATRFVQVAALGFKKAEHQAKQGDCKKALFSLIGAVSAEGQAVAHAHEGPVGTIKSSVQDKIFDLGMKAQNAVQKSCLIGGKLSGLGGRRRRVRKF